MCLCKRDELGAGMLKHRAARVLSARIVLSQSALILRTSAVAILLCCGCCAWVGGSYRDAVCAISNIRKEDWFVFSTNKLTCKLLAITELLRFAYGYGSISSITANEEHLKVIDNGVMIR